jgi:hypothetical protein
MNGNNENVILRPEPAIIKVTAIDPTVWMVVNFAQDWFVDALYEAKNGTDHNAVRREADLSV